MRFRALSLRAAVAAVASLAAVFLGGCSPYFFAVTEPPPAHQGRFAGEDDKGVEQILISKGVAVAIECREPWLGDPCAHATAISANPAIVAVLPSHLSEARDPYPYRYGYYGNSAYTAERTGFVVAGVAPGETTITVSTLDGDRVFKVIVANR
jgi:hypothetical protein